MAIKTTTKSLSPFYKETVQEFCEEPYLDKKANRAEDLYTQTVTYDGHTYDAGERSMDRIDRVLTLANALMNATITGLLAADPNKTMQQAHSEAYVAVYQTRPVPWKMADNSIAVVNAETLVHVQDQAMEGMKAIWLKYG